MMDREWNALEFPAICKGWEKRGPEMYFLLSGYGVTGKRWLREFRHEIFP